MQVWAVHYNPVSFTDQLYHRGLALLDSDSQARINRFYHRADACRVLLGRLLPRVLLKQRGIPLGQIAFGKTDAGKPFITSPNLDPPVGYNISHDDGLVAMVYLVGGDHPAQAPVPQGDPLMVGIDVMRVALPRYEPNFAVFVDNLGETLTRLERRILLDPALESGEALRRLYLIWTLKEAYTKALGLGLGFDFSRIEFNVPENELMIDGVPPRGWEFVAFPVTIQGANVDDQELYQGVIARFIGGDSESRVICRDGEGAAWFNLYDAPSIVRLAAEGNN